MGSLELSNSKTSMGHDLNTNHLMNINCHLLSLESCKLTPFLSEFNLPLRGLKIITKCSYNASAISLNIMAIRLFKLHKLFKIHKSFLVLNVRSYLFVHISVTLANKKQPLLNTKQTQKAALLQITIVMG